MKTRNDTLADVCSTSVVHVAPETSIAEALAVMHEANISSILVLEQGEPAGIFTERNILPTALKVGMGFMDKPVRSMMSFPVISARADTRVVEAYHLLRHKGVRHLVVVDEAGQAQGMATFTDILGSLDEEYFLRLNSVSSIMTRFGLTLPKETPLSEVFYKMVSVPLSCVVFAEDNRPVGIVTERDMARLFLEQRDLSRTSAAEVMSRPVRQVISGTTPLEARAIMRRERIRRLVVVDEQGAMQGLITQSDIVKGLEGQYVEYLRLRLEEKEQRYNNLFENAPVAMFHADVHGRLLRVNPELVRLLGYITGREVLNTVGVLGGLFVDAAQAEDIRERLDAQGGIFQCAVNVQRSDASSFQADFSATPVQGRSDRLLYWECFLVPAAARPLSDNRP